MEKDIRPQKLTEEEIELLNAISQKLKILLQGRKEPSHL